MRQVTAYRANKILYNFLRSNNLNGKVILPANICHEVVELLQYAGNELCFVDIDRDTLCLDWTQVWKYVKEVEVVLAVHTYGLEDSFNADFAILRTLNPKIVIIDDKCLCIPELDEPSSTGDLILYSTGLKKQVDLGVGGIGYVSDRWEYRNILVAENDVLTNEQWYFDVEAIKKQINRVLSYKSRLNAIYANEFPLDIQLQKYSQWRFNLKVPNKQEVLQAIFDAGLFASSHYAPQSDNCPNAQWLYEHVINLFNDFYFTEQQANMICVVIKDKLVQVNNGDSIIQ